MLTSSRPNDDAERKWIGGWIANLRKELEMTIRTRVLAPVAMVVVALVAAGLAMAAVSAKPATKKYSAALNVGQETGVVKSTKRGASGHFTATLSGTTLSYTLTFTHLSGSATAAHIHGPAARHVAAGVLGGLGGPCTSPVSGTVVLTQSQIDNLNAGTTYVNVHTAKNPGGEIRGQITAVG